MFYLKKIVLKKKEGVLGVVTLKRDADKTYIKITGAGDGNGLFISNGKEYAFYPLPLQKEVFTTLTGDLECGLLRGYELLSSGSTKGDNSVLSLPTHLSTWIDKERSMRKLRETPPTPPKSEQKPLPKAQPTPTPKKEEQPIPEKLIKAVEEEKKAQKSDFYSSIKKNLDEMFTCFPEERTLTRLIPTSKWARVDRSDGSYVVGLILDDATPAYVCYGMPGTADLTPPDNVKKYCQYLPTDDRSGYWIVFQDAKSGETLSKE